MHLVTPCPTSRPGSMLEPTTRLSARIAPKDNPIGRTREVEAPSDRRVDRFVNLRVSGCHAYVLVSVPPRRGSAPLARLRGRKRGTRALDPNSRTAIRGFSGCHAYVLASVAPGPVAAA